MLLEAQQGRVNRTLVQLDQIRADLLNPPRQAEAVQGAKDGQRFQDHEVQRSGKDFRLLLWHIYRKSATASVACQQERF